MSPFYFDESGIGKDSRFIGFGLLEIQKPNQIEKQLKQILDKWHFSDEIKFWKISNLRANIYNEWLDIYFKTGLKFFALIIDKNKVGENKIHHYLIEWFNTIITSSKEKSVYADADSPLEKKVVQELFQKDIALSELSFVDSKSNLLIQLNDLLLGAIRASYEKKLKSKLKREVVKRAKEGIKKKIVVVKKI